MRRGGGLKKGQDIHWKVRNLQGGANYDKRRGRLGPMREISNQGLKLGF